MNSLNRPIGFFLVNNFVTSLYELDLTMSINLGVPSVRKNSFVCAKKFFVFITCRMHFFCNVVIFLRLLVPQISEPYSRYGRIRLLYISNLVLIGR